MRVDDELDTNRFETVIEHVFVDRHTVKVVEDVTGCTYLMLSMFTGIDTLQGGRYRPVVYRLATESEKAEVQQIVEGFGNPDYISKEYGRAGSPLMDLITFIAYGPSFEWQDGGNDV